jgi:hypothetical protein
MNLKQLSQLPDDIPTKLGPPLRMGGNPNLTPAPPFMVEALALLPDEANGWPMHTGGIADGPVDTWYEKTFERLQVAAQASPWVRVGQDWISTLVDILNADRVEIRTGSLNKTFVGSRQAKSRLHRPKPSFTVTVNNAPAQLASKPMPYLANDPDDDGKDIIPLAQERTTKFTAHLSIAKTTDGEILKDVVLKEMTKAKEIPSKDKIIEATVRVKQKHGTPLAKAIIRQVGKAEKLMDILPERGDDMLKCCEQALRMPEAPAGYCLVLLTNAPLRNGTWDLGYALT